jgi:metal-responsive CopG/Arc/MetJ family transcriptional regulator
VSVAIGIELASALDNVARRRYLTRAEMLREIICEYLAGVAGRGG